MIKIAGYGRMSTDKQQLSPKVQTYMAENDVTLDDTPQKIKDQVHAWNWNHSIFDIYDEIKSRPDSEIAELLTFALQVFKDNVYTYHQIQDLAMHLGVDHLVTEKQERAT